MISYLIRRLLLVIPTLIGMTMLVFFVMALSPGGAGADMGRAEGMRPEERRALQKYLNERYGLDRPYIVQYGHWLNNVSPIGFKTYIASDPQVIEAAKAAAALPLHKGQHPKPTPRAGDIRFSKPTIKVTTAPHARPSSIAVNNSRRRALANQLHVTGADRNI